MKCVYFCGPKLSIDCYPICDNEIWSFCFAVSVQYCHVHNSEEVRQMEIKSILTSFISRGFFLLLCKPWSLTESCFHALVAYICVGEGSEGRWDFSPHAEDSGWNKGKKIKLF